MASYNIRPEASKKFQATKVKNLLKSVLEKECSKVEYNEKTASKFPEEMTIILINKLNELEFGTYKYVVNVLFGEQRGAGIQGFSKCYWDSDTDACATYTHITNKLYCIATVFGIYYY